MTQIPIDRQMRLAIFGIQNILIQIVSIVFKSNFDLNIINYNQLLIKNIQKLTIFQLFLIIN